MSQSKMRCKFVVESITLQSRDGGGKLIARPVSSGSDENEKFFRYTPCGTLEIGTVNGESLKNFRPEQEFYLDLVPIQPEA